MLYKFKSQATPDLIMLEPHGRQLLTLLGQGDDAGLKQGLIRATDAPAAIATLHAAVAADDARRAATRAQAVAEAAAEGRAPPPQPDDVSLHQRCAPFIEMLKRCHAADTALVWGV